MSTATTRNPFCGTDYTILLDASFDLHAAGVTGGMDCDEREEAIADFVRKFRQAADRLEAETGIEISIIRGSYDGPKVRDQSENGDEGDVWQAIHNRCC